MDSYNTQLSPSMTILHTTTALLYSLPSPEPLGSYQITNIRHKSQTSSDEHLLSDRQPKQKLPTGKTEWTPWTLTFDKSVIKARLTRLPVNARIVSRQANPAGKQLASRPTRYTRWRAYHSHRHTHTQTQTRTHNECSRVLPTWAGGAAWRHCRLPISQVYPLPQAASRRPVAAIESIYTTPLYQITLSNNYHMFLPVQRLASSQSESSIKSVVDHSMHSCTLV